MGFLRGVWRFLVGIKDALALLFLVLFFTLIFAATQSSTPLTVPSGSALLLDLDGVVVDQATERSPFEMIAGTSNVVPEVQVRDVVEAIDRAREDSRIKSIVLQMDGFYGTGMANLQTIGDALKAFKAKGKPIYAYSSAYVDDSYYLGAHATEAWLNPLGAVLLTGPGGPGLYFKGTLDKLGVDVNVFRVGTYKAAVEPFTRTEASPEARAAEQALVDTLWDTWTSDVQAARPKVKVDAITASFPQRLQAAGGDFGQQALADGLVDKIGTYVDFGQAMAKRVGEGDDDRPGAYNQVDYRDYLRASSSRRSSTGGAVGVVYVSGEIVDGKAGRGMAGGDTIADLIAEAVADENIKALVVRVDSPGGSVTASEKIRQALVDAKADGLPVVASFGSVAASGGYWIATAADQIYAEPATITGSIGVFAMIPTFEKTLAKVGLSADGVKSTPFSGEPDVLRGMSPEVNAVLQASVENIYKRFTGLVGKARNLPVNRVDEIGQGRVWAGGTAHQLKLVDHLGGLDDAIAVAAKRAGLGTNARVVAVEVKPSFPFQLAEQFFAPQEQQQQPGTDAFAQLTRGNQLRAVGSLMAATQVASGPTLQARCLSCAGLTVDLPDPRQAQGFLATIGKLFD
ncbi:signal peptide peptidase SppA [Sphingoaurantiacus capsulatus]|uniref:Signal peptide peptidase SppA n=1 Tax=Sphingoaurantiacus capsulatus TaxID=1771310 RepID=A0ABV7XE29_9SPHN